ncbi:MAG: hypothetical protein AB9833_05655 [Bacteroidales bacterium]
MKILYNKKILVLRRLKMILLFLFFVNGIVAQNSIGFIEKVQKYQDSVKLIRTGKSPDFIDTSTFNINKYLQYFDKLYFPKGFKCHYVFWDGGMGGYPILYVKKDSFKMERYLKNKIREFIKQCNIDKTKITPRLIDFQKNNLISKFAKSNYARKYVIPEDNEAGYLQYLFFNRFGEQFVLKWHSYYSQKSVIFSDNEMMRLYNYYSKSDQFSCTIEEFAKLLKIDPTPIIEMRNDKCVITWYEILTHFGIHKMTYEISRSSPYTIDTKEDIELLKLNMEFIY